MDMKENNLSRYSVAGFCKGELVCCIIVCCQCNIDRREEKVYISDINGRNYRYLKWLLQRFLVQFEQFIFTAGLKVTYRLMKG